MHAWDPAAPGVLVLPSGRRVRGRALHSSPAGLRPDFGLYLLAVPPPPMEWPARWVQWPDFRLPTQRDDAKEAMTEAWRRSGSERVEVACRGGRGRTGTALACLAILDGVPAEDAVAFVRAGYDPWAVETPWQRRYVRGFAEH